MKSGTIDLGAVLAAALCFVPKSSQANAAATISQLKSLVPNASEYPTELLPSFQLSFAGVLSHTTLSIRSQKNYRNALSRLLRISVEHELIDPHVLTDGDYPKFERLGTPAHCRLVQSYDRFVKWAKQQQITYSALSAAHVEEYHAYLMANRRLSISGLYCDLRNFWSMKMASNELKTLVIPSRANKWIYGVPKEQWPSRVLEDFAEFERRADMTTGIGSKTTKPLSNCTLHDYALSLGRYIHYLLEYQPKLLNEQELCGILSNIEVICSYLAWQKARAKERLRGSERKFLKQAVVILETLRPSSNEPIQRLRTMIKEWRQPNRPRPKLRDIVEERHTLYQAGEQALRDARESFDLWVSEGSPMARAAEVASSYQDALIFAFLFSCPLRAQNVIGAKLDQNVWTSESGYKLEFGPDETKWNTEIRHDWPEELLSPLEFFLSQVRPLLNTEASDFLFLTRRGHGLKHKALHTRMTRLGKRYLQIHTNPHHFRKLVATAILNEHPNLHYAVRDLLSHKSLRTTLRDYTEHLSLHASRSMQDFVRGNCPNFALMGTWSGNL